MSGISETTNSIFLAKLPHVHAGQDRILIQYVDIPIDFDAIRVYGDMSRQLKYYVIGEQDRVLNQRCFTSDLTTPGKQPTMGLE